MADDYQNIYRYSRKTYKKNRKNEEDGNKDESTAEMAESPRSEVRFDWCNIDAPTCSCAIPDQERDIATILHKKCPVISLAQQQLQRLLDGTDRLLCDHDRCCRSIYDFICICKEILMTQNKAQCVLVILIALAFMTGLILGAASCGTYLGRFESPILSCIDSFFIPDSFPTHESFGIV